MRASRRVEVDLALADSPAPAAPLGCRGLALVMGLSLVLPFLVDHCPGAGARPRAPRSPAARTPLCLEVWVLLRSHRGSPVLAAAGGYRLGIACAPGASCGLLALAGAFPGHAIVSDRPVPLGRWVHLAAMAGMEDGDGPTGIANEPAAPVPAWLAIDGQDVTAGRFLACMPPLPLGRDPWPTATSPDTTGARAAPGLDGLLGARRCSRRWRTLAEVAAARGNPWRLGALPPPAPLAPNLRHFGGLTPRGWVIVVVGVFAAAAMLTAGLRLHPPSRAATAALSRAAPPQPSHAWPPPSNTGRHRPPPLDLGPVRREPPPEERS